MKALLRSIVVAFVSFLFIAPGNAQLLQYSIGGSGYELATRVQYLTSDQSTIIAGYSYDYTGGVVSNCQAIVMKVYHGGTIAWQKTFGLPLKNNIIKDMIITADGNIVVVGTVGGAGSAYADNNAAILKYNALTGQLMWQKCFRNTITTSGGELFNGVTELSDGRLVAVGNHNFTGSGCGGMICVFQSSGTLLYNEVIDLSGGDEMYKVTTDAAGTGVYICGILSGSTYKDGRVLSYTPGTSSGTVNWTKYFDFALMGSMTNNFIDEIFLSGSKIVVAGDCLNGYSTASGAGHFVMSLNAADGSGAQLRGIQNSGAAYANMTTIAVVDSDHIFSVQSPGATYYDATSALTGTSSDAVVTELTSITSSTTNTPVRFKSSVPGLHSFLGVDYESGLLHLAGATNVSGGFGNNDIYYVATGMGLASWNASCDTAHETVNVTSPTITNPTFSYSTFSFTPVYITVDTATTHFGISQLCGDPDIFLPSRVQSIAATTAIYPNPATCTFTVSAAENITTLSIFNTLGQEVYNDTYNSEKVTVDCSNFSAGIYFVQINGNKWEKVTKQ